MIIEFQAIFKKIQIFVNQILFDFLRATFVGIANEMKLTQKFWARTFNTKFRTLKILDG